jgi:hypothetical protein
LVHMHSGKRQGTAALQNLADKSGGSFVTI